MKITTRKFSIFKRLIFSSIAITIVTTLLVGGVSYYNLSQTQLELMRDNLLNITASGNLLIDGDTHAAYQIGDESTDKYKQEIALLNELAVKSNACYIYTLVKQGEGTAFVLDSSGKSIVGDVYELTPEMEAAFSGERIYTKEPYTDEFGTFISAYEPLYDSNKSIVAIVVADYDISVIKEKMLSILVKMLVTCLLAIAIAIFLNFISASRIKKSIYEILQKTTEIVGNSGDLTQRIQISSGDEFEELGKRINELIENIYCIVKSVVKTSDEVFAEAKQTIDISSNMSELAKDQASGMKELSSTAEEMASSISVVAVNTSKFAQVIQDAAQTGHVATQKVNETIAFSLKGKEAMEKMLAGMDNISTSTKDLSTSVLQVGESSNQIKGIVKLIQDIATQTNLLALNAAIEAARAGEAGKGFAVVADEIRKLAENSTTATKTISDLIDQVETVVEETVKVADESSTVIQKNVKRAKSTGETFDTIFSAIQETSIMLQEIIKHVEAVNELAQDVAAVTQEQSASSQEILATSQGVSEMADQILDGNKQIVSASQTLSIGAQELHDVISKFKID